MKKLYIEESITIYIIKYPASQIALVLKSALTVLYGWLMEKILF